MLQPIAQTLMPKTFIKKSPILQGCPTIRRFGRSGAPEYTEYDPNIWGYIREVPSTIQPNIRGIFQGAFGIFGRIALRTSLPDNSNWFCNFEYAEPEEHPRTSRYPGISPEYSGDIPETFKIFGGTIAPNVPGISPEYSGDVPGHHLGRTSR